MRSLAATYSSSGIDVHVSCRASRVTPEERVRQGVLRGVVVGAADDAAALVHQRTGFGRRVDESSSVLKKTIVSSTRVSAGRWSRTVRYSTKVSGPTSRGRDGLGGLGQLEGLDEARDESTTGARSSVPSSSTTPSTPPGSREDPRDAVVHAELAAELLEAIPQQVEHGADSALGSGEALLVQALEQDDERRPLDVVRRGAPVVEQRQEQHLDQRLVGDAPASSSRAMGGSPSTSTEVRVAGDVADEAIEAVDLSRERARDLRAEDLEVVGPAQGDAGEHDAATALLAELEAS